LNIFMVVMRLIHIPTGIFWVGGVLMMVTFISRSAEAIGEDATKFMQHFSLRSGFQQSMAGAGSLAVLSGLFMYDYLFDSRLAPLNSGAGLSLTIGGIAGIAALLVGLLVIGRGTNRMRAIANEIAGSGKPPKPEQLKEIGSLQEKLSSAGGNTAILMVIAIIGMTLSEYFAF
jgi:hypothetical protein